MMQAAQLTGHVATMSRTVDSLKVKIGNLQAIANSAVDVVEGVGLDSLQEKISVLEVERDTLISQLRSEKTALEKAQVRAARSRRLLTYSLPIMVKIFI